MDENVNIEKALLKFMRNVEERLSRIETRLYISECDCRTQLTWCPECACEGYVFDKKHKAVTCPLCKGEMFVTEKEIEAWEKSKNG